WFQTPNRPHSSWNLSSSWKSCSSGDMSLKPVPPRVIQLGERRRENRLPAAPHVHHGPANPPQPRPRQGELPHQALEVPLRLGPHRYDAPRRPLAEEGDVEATPVVWKLDGRPDGPRPRHAALGQSHRQPPLRAIVRRPKQPGRDGRTA